MEAGGWNERLHANEDFEADLRVAASGWSIWLEPSATSTWFVRESIHGVALQMWRYGYYKAITLKLHPRSLRLRQTAPPALVLALVTGLVQRSRAGVLLGLAYALSAGMLGAMAARSDGASPWRGAAIPPTVHLSWGAGLLVGLIKGTGRVDETGNRRAG